MQTRRIPGDTVVNRAGRTIYHRGESGAVLVLHGWTGWTDRVAYLCERLSATGRTVYAPRLPGHGTNTPDLLETGRRDWVRRAVDSYLDLAADGGEVSVVGHSMGAILAAIVASRFPVRRLALLAPAFINTNRLLALAPLLHPLIRRIRSDWDPDTVADPVTRELAREYGTYNYLKPAAELFRLQREGRRALREVACDTLVVVSEKDRTVPTSVTDLIRRLSPATQIATVVVRNGDHQIAESEAREEVADAVVSWLGGLR